MLDSNYTVKQLLFIMIYVSLTERHSMKCLYQFPFYIYISKVEEILSALALRFRRLALSTINLIFFPTFSFSLILV